MEKLPCPQPVGVALADTLRSLEALAVALRAANLPLDTKSLMDAYDALQRRFA